MSYLRYVCRFVLFHLCVCRRTHVLFMFGSSVFVCRRAHVLFMMFGSSYSSVFVGGLMSY